ncbi:hypothetical protein QOZ80_1AG0045540 [Eleusine coracana subsp. coracana]|nr:hypothetical protein QOZ80_1AG0045540 [Eleusine coracana subsp. coracana]
MPPRGAALIVVAVLIVILVATPREAAAQMTVVDPGSWVSDHGAACTGTVEECVAASTSTRRELGRGGYISYDAMSRGRVPCSIRGASYYNCRPGAPANPYSRGCSAITRCRG